MPNYDQPHEQPSVEKAELNEETMREIISEMYFDSAPPKTLTETAARIQRIAKERGISAEKLEEELCGWIADEMGNVVD